jgi:hypothetical protein
MFYRSGKQEILVGPCHDVTAAGAMHRKDGGQIGPGMAIRHHIPSRRQLFGTTIQARQSGKICRFAAMLQPASRLVHYPNRS